MNENIFPRNIKDINIIKFKDALTDVQWNDDIELNDVNACYENFISTFLIYMINSFQSNVKE